MSVTVDSPSSSATGTNPDAPPDRASPSRAWIVWLVALFVLSSLAVLPLLTRYRGDERFYTDAAIRMVQSGDWLTPHYGDGQLRFRKPILPYWLVAVPFRAFGIGVFTSRLGALAMAALMLFLSARLAMILTRDRRCAILTVAMLVSTVQVMNLATRATTDALQAACATLAMVGFAGALFDRDERGRPRAASLTGFYLGVGLVAASKGGLAVLLLAFAAVLVLWRGRRLNISLRDLVHVPSMLAAIVLGLGWFAAVLIKYGRVAWEDFWNDQVGTRVQGGLLPALQHLAQDVASIPTELLPWFLLILVVGVGQWRRARAFVVEHREQTWFAALWLGLLLATFAGANIQRARYFLPAYPLLAILASGVLLRLWADDAKARERQTVALRGIAIAAVIVSLALLGLGLRVDPLVAGGGAACAVIATLMLIAVRRGAAGTEADAWRQAIVFAVVLLASYRASDLLTRRPLFPPSGPDIVRAVATHAPGADRVAAVDVPPGQLGQVRLLTGGRLEVDPLPAETSIESLGNYDAIVYRAAPTTLPAGFETAPAGSLTRGWRTQDVIAVGLGRRARAEVLASRETPLTLAYRAGPTTRHAAPATLAPTVRDTEDEE